MLALSTPGRARIALVFESMFACLDRSHVWSTIAITHLECLSLLCDSCDSRCDSDSDAMGEAEVQSAIGRQGESMWCIGTIFL